MRRGVRWTPATYARGGADRNVRRPPHGDRSTGWGPRIAVLRRHGYNEAVAGAAARQRPLRNGWTAESRRRGVGGGRDGDGYDPAGLARRTPWSPPASLGDEPSPS